MCECVCACMRVCMSQHKQFVANFRPAGFCCAPLPPSPRSNTQCGAESRPQNFWAPMWCVCRETVGPLCAWPGLCLAPPRRTHWLVSGRRRKPGSGNVRRLFALHTSVFSSSSSPSFFVNKYREATTGIARLWMGGHRGTRRLENFLKDLKFLLFCKIDEVICLAIAHKVCVPMFFKKKTTTLRQVCAHKHIHMYLLTHLCQLQRQHAHSPHFPFFISLCTLAKSRKCFATTTSVSTSDLPMSSALLMIQICGKCPWLNKRNAFRQQSGQAQRFGTWPAKKNEYPLSFFVLLFVYRTFNKQWRRNEQWETLVLS